MRFIVLIVVASACKEHPTDAPVPQTNEYHEQIEQGQNVDEATLAIKLCGRPSRDFEDTQANIKWRHLTYNKPRVELSFQRFPAWTFLGGAELDEGGTPIDSADLNKRMQCTEKLTSALDARMTASSHGSDR